MKLVIDRFEGEYAVCENDDNEVLNIHISDLPENSKEGDIIYKKNNSIVIDKKCSKERKKHIEEIVNDIWQ